MLRPIWAGFGGSFEVLQSIIESLCLGMFDPAIEMSAAPCLIAFLTAASENLRATSNASARDDEPFDRAIDVRITRIRRKIEPDPKQPRFIQTVRGAGYLFSPSSVPR